MRHHRHQHFLIPTSSSCNNSAWKRAPKYFHIFESPLGDHKPAKPSRMAMCSVIRSPPPHVLSLHPPPRNMARQAFITSTANLATTTFRRPLIAPTRVAHYARATTRRARMHHEAPTTMPSITTSAQGEENTLSYRLFYKTDDANISPWHDIPIYPDPENRKVVNFVNEIPRGTQAKMEIATDEMNTPIKQDVKKGALRFYQYGPSLVNYGAIPQTWEDPGSLNPELNVCGDGDPVDVCEIGSVTMPFGAVYKVKILGCLALLDEGEIDWKIIAINTEDPLAGEINDVTDVQRVLPGRVDDVREWFRLYKTAEGKGENEYGYNGDCKNCDFAVGVVEETHQSWADLRTGKIENEDGLALK